MSEERKPEDTGHADKKVEKERKAPICANEHASGMVCIRPAGHPEKVKHKSSTGWLW